MEAFTSQVLWDHMNALSTKLVGWEIPTYFSIFGDFPQFYLLVPTIVIFLATIHALQYFFRVKNIDLSKNPIVNWYAFFHNVFMSALSLYMFVDCIAILYRNGALNSVQSYLAFCGTPKVWGPLYDIFFYSKYLELIDTFILVFKRKHLGFLHLFHHSTTASVAYLTRYHPLWIGVWTNAFVHVLMYFHFARPVQFLRKYLTSLQIIQFLFVMSTYYYWYWYYSTITFNEFIYPYSCYIVYLVFFVDFFIKNYIYPAKKDRTGDAKKSETKKSK